MNERIEAMEKALERARNIASIYDALIERRKYDAMDYRVNDNNEGEYGEPSDDSYNKPLFDAYNEVLAMIEKMVK